MKLMVQKNNFLEIAIGKYENPYEAFDELRGIYEFNITYVSGSILKKNSFKCIEAKKRINPFFIAEKILKNEDWIKEKNAPAGCIEIKRSYLKKIKEVYGMKGKQKIKCFIFFGYYK